MCKPKSIGGMGFRDLGVFNDALLGKQIWRLMTNGNTLLSRVLKAKYFPHSSVLEAALGPCSSFSWRSIWSSKSLVKHVLLWRVGNGMSIKVWDDPWLAGDANHFVSTERKDGVATLVADLIDRDRCCWDLAKVESTFTERDRNLILDIPISVRLPVDSWMWAWSKDGAYEVKSAYHFGKSYETSNVESFWAAVWSVEVSPKVRHFLWRCASNSLPTRSVLRSRHLLEDAACPWCGLEDESISHTLFYCTMVRHLWMGCCCEEAANIGEESSFGEILLSWVNSSDQKLSQRACFLAWSIWHRRNKWVFEQVKEPDNVFLNRVWRLVEDFGNYTEKIYGGTTPNSNPSSSVWSPPPMGVIKVNVDAAVSEEGWVGLGTVARNDKGEVMYAAVRRVRARWSPLIAECRAALFGLEQAQQHGLSEVILASDSASLVNKMSKNLFMFSLVDSVLEDISSVSCNFNSLRWAHVKRDGNSVAHHLAKVVPFGEEQCWENHSPSEVSSYVLMDSLSF